MSARKSAEEGTQKQLDPEESDNQDEVYSPFDDPTITKEGTRKQ